MLKSQFLEEFAVLHQNMAGDSSRWFKGPTPVVHWSHTCGTNEQKKFFFKSKFQPLPKIISYWFFVRGQRRRWSIFML